MGGSPPAEMGSAADFEPLHGPRQLLSGCERKSWCAPVTPGVRELGCLPLTTGRSSAPRMLTDPSSRPIRGDRAPSPRPAEQKRALFGYPPGQAIQTDSESLPGKGPASVPRLSERLGHEPPGHGRARLPEDGSRTAGRRCDGLHPQPGDDGSDRESQNPSPNRSLSPHRAPSLGSRSVQPPNGLSVCKRRTTPSRRCI